MKTIEQITQGKEEQLGGKTSSCSHCTKSLEFNQCSYFNKSLFKILSSMGTFPKLALVITAVYNNIAYCQILINKFLME